MNRRMGLIALIAAAAIIAVAAGVVAFSDNGDENKIVTTVSDLDQYGNLCLDVLPEELHDRGIAIGDDVRVASGDESFVAMCTEFYSGIASYGAFIELDNGKTRVGFFNLDTGNCTEIKKGDTVTLTREGRNPYVDKMPDYMSRITEDPADYPSIEAFANFRTISGGEITPDSAYRSASPWTAGVRSTYVDDFCRDNGIESMICIDEDTEDIAALVKENPDTYSSKLFLDGKVICKKLQPSIHASPEDFRFVMDSYLDSDGKLCIFCALGRDRTGAYSAVLEGLAGATYDEIRADYMLSFCNYYNIKEGSQEYEVVAEIMVDRVLYLFNHTSLIPHPEKVDWANVEFEKYDPEEVFSKYLTEYVGLSEDEVQKVKDKLTTTEIAI